MDYVWLAILSGFFQYLIQSTIRIYREFLYELLPQLAEENQYNIQFDLIYGFLENRWWRVTFLIPVAFLCTFILLPYDLAKAWRWIEQRILRLLGSRMN